MKMDILTSNGFDELHSPYNKQRKPQCEVSSVFLCNIAVSCHFQKIWSHARLRHPNFSHFAPRKPATGLIFHKSRPAMLRGTRFFPNSFLQTCGVPNAVFSCREKFDGVEMRSNPSVRKVFERYLYQTPSTIVLC